RPKRFDTKFYLIAAPETQSASHDNGESVDSAWTTPTKALGDSDAGIWTLVFVTRANLIRLAERGATVEAAFKDAANTEIHTLTPIIERGDGGMTFSIPENMGYSLTKFTQEKPPI
ncbi:MAG: NUDIX hydrolase, partial [Rhodospirillales bacterium]|nr:NUDIX hydrolase [Rhodospirillales bacterium]